MIAPDEARIALKVLSEVIEETRRGYGEKALQTAPEGLAEREAIYAQARALNDVEAALRRPVQTLMIRPAPQG